MFYLKSGTMANQPTTTEPIQLAQILSDLNSLRACDPSSALALVSARPNTSTSTITSSVGTTSAQDAELNRAKDLLRLHHEVKEAHTRGELGKELEEAREAVRRSVGG
ncbi:Fumarylacetoacetase C-terminal [Pyrenophora seminiperda CCB06]|uniref:Fumarylacetoacetase C-terminal n=1 Tax=Pyrenophora seminiperda CCB06 TaxID=1302712 RepID=A0A3M7LWM8_9PLEO|nr:Fumarylacetoacetase C-terminal [Pyrenophora seminiperda CCB06]